MQPYPVCPESSQQRAGDSSIKGAYGNGTFLGCEQVPSLPEGWMMTRITLRGFSCWQPRGVRMSPDPVEVSLTTSPISTRFNPWMEETTEGGKATQARALRNGCRAV